jgi:hypothetical protein
MVTAVVFIATFNNISVISWRSVLLVEETRLPEVSDNLYPEAVTRRKLKIEQHEPNLQPGVKSGI